MDWPPTAVEDTDERPMQDEVPDSFRLDPFSEAVGDAWESAMRRNQYPFDDAD